jgi:hypothetical protein
VSGVRIGIDFDNTIICYDKVFSAAAQQRGLIRDGWVAAKSEIRDYLRSQPGGEVAWQGLQGWVYGKGIREAEIFSGVRDFLVSCRHANVSVYIVSHKTKFGHQDPDRTDLREAARGWMRSAGLLDTPDSGLTSDNVHFEGTLAAKVDRLARLELDIFIDDLVDVFEQPHFPRQTRAILFGGADTRFTSCTTWADVTNEVFAA